MFVVALKFSVRPIVVILTFKEYCNTAFGIIIRAPVDEFKLTWLFPLKIDPF